MNKIVFLDRDGTINVEKNYLYKIEEFEFIDGVPQAIKLLNDDGFKVIVITNQAGVARGFYTESDVNKLHGFIQNELKKYEAHIDAFYYCPHHPEGTIEKYKEICNCRKPGTGLFIKALSEFDADAYKSFVIGDKITDLIPGKVLGMHTILVKTGYGAAEKDKGNYYDYQVEDLAEASELIVNIKL